MFDELEGVVSGARLLLLYGTSVISWQAKYGI